MFISFRAVGLIVIVRMPPADVVTGTNAMPQMGHFPGPSRRICGCIEHVQIFGASAC